MIYRHIALKKKKTCSVFYSKSMHKNSWLSTSAKLQTAPFMPTYYCYKPARSVV